MNLLLLPGHAPKHRLWADNVHDEFGPHFGMTIVQYYGHWLDGASGQRYIDHEKELDALRGQLVELDDYIVMAYGAGVVLALQGIHEGVIAPEVGVFVGTPLHWARHAGFDLDNWMLSYQVPTLYIQHQDDPGGGLADMMWYLNDRETQSQYVEAYEHAQYDYADVARLLGMVKDFVDLE
jgi:hypothetical protein